jgi:hypothetical protein
METRLDLAPLLSGVGVEIGVGSGCFSRHLLENSKLFLLFSIDPWSMEYPGFLSKEHAQACYNATCSALAKFSHRSVVVRQAAELFVENIDDNSIDFVYIDSSHTYQETSLQMKLWWPKIKSGGILSGHDYSNTPQIQQAVIEFCELHQLVFETTINDKTRSEFIVNSWIIYKP